jgi:uncharacterized protein involved in exopolysaccharide biosynthesis
MEEKIKNDITVLELINGVKITIRYLFSKWLIILLIAFISGLLGVLYAWLEKPAYIAEMTFVTDNDNASKLSSYAGLAAQFGFDLGGGNNNAFEGENLVELLKSRSLIEKTLLSRVSQEELLIDYYLRISEVSNKWSDKTETKDIRFETNYQNNTRIEDSILSVLYKDFLTGKLEVYKKDKKTNLIVVRMTSGDEIFSKAFVELLATNAIQYYTEYKIRKAKQNVEILQRQTDSVRTMLFGSITDVAAIADLNVNPNKQILRSSGQKKQVDVQVNGALYTELLKNLELAKLSLRKETPLIQVIDSPRLPLEKKKHGRFHTGLFAAILGGITSIVVLAFLYQYKKMKKN